MYPWIFESLSEWHPNPQKIMIPNTAADARRKEAPFFFRLAADRVGWAAAAA